MSITIHCPGCQTLLTLSEALMGKPTKCSRCFGVFTAPDALPAALPVETALPVEPDDEIPDQIPVANVVPSFPPSESSPNPEAVVTPEATGDFDWRTVDFDRNRPLGTAKAWRSARAGLWTFLTLFLVLTFTFTAHLVVDLFLNSPVLLMLSQPLIQGVSWVVFLLGLALCCNAPSASGSRSLAIAALICTVLGLSALTALVIQQGQSQNVLSIKLDIFREKPLFWFGSALLLISNLLFVLYLRAVASYFNNQPVAENLIAVIVLVLISPVVLIVLDLLQRFLADFGMLFRLLQPTYLIGLTVWVSLSLWSLIVTMDKRTSHDEPEFPVE